MTLGFLFKILNMINGWEVELVGGLLYLAFLGFFFRDVTGLILLGLLAVYVVSRLTKTFHFLANFADEKFWPAFVALGIACLVAYGHPHGRFIVGSVLTIYDGMYFEQNY